MAASAAVKSLHQIRARKLVKSDTASSPPPDTFDQKPTASPASPTSHTKAKATKSAAAHTDTHPPRHTASLPPTAIEYPKAIHHQPISASPAPPPPAAAPSANAADQTAASAKP